MAEDLGVARLVVVADTSQALAALERLRSTITTGVGDVGSTLFTGIEAKAVEAGTKAGSAFKQGFDAAAKADKLKFDNFTQALEFDPKNTINGLNEYLTALRELRDSSELGWVSTQKLTDRIGALESALQRSKRTTAEAAEEQRQFNQALERSQTKREAEEARALAEAARQAAQAQRDEAAAAKQAADAAKQNASRIQQQIAAYRTLATVAGSGIGAAAGAAGSVGRGIGAVGRGISAVGKGAVKAGKFGYELGAEFGVFEAPRTGPIKEAIQQVIDRFKFLGEQALTARGAILRSVEALGALGVGGKVIENIDLIKASLGGIDLTAKAASGGLNVLKNTLGAGFGFIGDKLPNNAIGDLAKLIGDTIDASAGLGNASRAFTDFATNGLASGLDGLQAFQQALQSIPPEAQAAALALAGLAAGAISNQTNVSVNDIAEALDRVRNNALDAVQTLRRLGDATPLVMQQTTALQGSGLTDEERQQRARNAARLQALRQFIQEFGAEQRKLSQLALPSSEMLAEGGRRIQRLTPTGLNRSNEAQVSALRQSVEEASKLAAAERQAQGAQTQLNAALEAGFRVLQQMVPIIEEQTQGYKTQTAEIQEQLQVLEQKRALEQQLANDARRRLAEDAKRRADEKQSRQDRLLSGLFPGVSPADEQERLARAKRKQGFRGRLGESASNALIGGAFPLLFGQGLGASIGGGLGGGLGGLAGGGFGFGASLIGTAVGAAFDQMLTKGRTLAEGLRDPIGKFDQLKEAGLISSKSVEQTVSSLIAAGREAEAYAMIQADLARLGGSEDLAKLNESFDVLKRRFAELGVTIADFVAGPLADFLNKLAAGVSVFPLKAQAEQRLGRLNPKQQEQVLAAGRKAALRLEGKATIPEAAAAMYRAQIDAADKLLGKTQQQKDAENGILTARARYSALADLAIKQIDAQVQGYQTISTLLDRQRTVLERDNKLAATPTNDSAARNAIRDQANQDLYRLDQQIKKENELATLKLSSTRQLAGLEGPYLAFAQKRLEAEQEIARLRKQKSLASDNLSSALSARASAEALPSSTIGERQYRFDKISEAADQLNAATVSLDTAQKQLIDAGLNNAQGLSALTRQFEQERQRVKTEIGIAQRGNTITDTGRNAIRQAEDLKRQLPDVQRLRDEAISRPENFDLAKQAQDASQSLRAAGLALRNSLEEAAKSAKLTVESITRSVRDRQLGIAELQNTSGNGINKYLTPQQVQQRQQAINPQLQAQAQAALDRYKSRTGQDIALNVTGTVEERNAAFIDIARAFNEEGDAIQDLITEQRNLSVATADLSAITASLTSVNQELTTAIGPLASQIGNLVAKNWGVSVNVDSRGNVRAFGDVLAGSL